jgi:hypothetical protein
MRQSSSNPLAAAVALLALLAAACATTLPPGAAVIMPAPATVTLYDQDVPTLGLRVRIGPGWRATEGRPDDLRWEGPPRALGRAALRLVSGDRYQRSLKALASAAADMQGVRRPPEPTESKIAGREAMCTSGVRGLSDRRTVICAWRDDEATRLLIAEWTSAEDGPVVAAMLAALEPLPAAEPRGR